MEGKENKKKTKSFFCCSSSGNKKRQIKESITTSKKEEEEVNNSINSNNKAKLSHASSLEKNVQLENNNYNQNIKSDHNKIPKIPTKENSLINNNDSSVRSVTTKIPDKKTLPNSEAMNRSLTDSEPKKNFNTGPIIQNLFLKFDEAADTGQNATTRQEPLNFNQQVDFDIPNEENHLSATFKEKKHNDLYQYNNSSHKDRFSVKEGVEFTFKRSIVDTRSEMPLASVKNMYTGNYNEILDYINNRESFKQSVSTVYNNTNSKANLHNNEVGEKLEVDNFSQLVENEKPATSSENNTIENPTNNNNTITIPSVQMNPFDKKLSPLTILEENLVSDEYGANDQNESNSAESEARSMISSQVLSHINTPKMITGIKSSTDQSMRFSVYSKSELSNLVTENNILMTDQVFLPINLPSQADDTEFEITNENSDRFNKFIETPKSSNLFFSNLRNFQHNLSSQNTMTVNPHLKEINDKLNKKDREAKKLNEKIQKIVSDLHKLEEENKRYERRIEKEEAEGEMLRHMLNFLTSNA